MSVIMCNAGVSNLVVFGLSVSYVIEKHHKLAKCSVDLVD